MPHSFNIYLGTNVSPQTKRLEKLYSWVEFYRANRITWRDGRNILQELEDEIVTPFVLGNQDDFLRRKQKLVEQRNRNERIRSNF